MRSLTATLSLLLSASLMLAQSLALPLLERVLTQASEQNQIRAAWQPLLNGLRLWQVWDLPLPLATWRAEVVQGVYSEAAAASGSNNA